MRSAWIALMTVWLSTGCVAGGLGPVLAPNGARAREPIVDLTVYVSPTGDDASSGRTRDQPVQSIARAHAIVVGSAPTGNVTVLFDSGGYRRQSVDWTFRPAPGKRVTFRPRVWDGAHRPTFHACATDGSACVPRSFFRLAARGATNVTFDHLAFERYQTVLNFDGSPTNERELNSGNQVLHCVFHEIGQLWQPTLPPAAYAVRLQNSRDNEVAWNEFDAVRNREGPELIHPLYLAHGASHNEIHHNTFRDSSGDAIKIRDRSNFNRVHDNVATLSGEHALVNDWYERSSGECPSWGTLVESNTTAGLGSCQGALGFYYDYGFGTNGCSGPPGAPRVTERHNTQGPLPTCDRSPTSEPTGPTRP